MAEPDPTGSVFRWAFWRAGHHKKSFWIGSVSLAALLIVTNAVVQLPTEPTRAQKITNGLVGLGIAVAAVVILAVVYALLVAPYEQRNSLRKLVATLENDMDSVKAEMQERADVTGLVPLPILIPQIVKLVADIDAFLDGPNTGGPPDVLRNPPSRPLPKARQDAAVAARREWESRQLRPLCRRLLPILDQCFGHHLITSDLELDELKGGCIWFSNAERAARRLDSIVETWRLFNNSSA